MTNKKKKKKSTPSERIDEKVGGILPMVYGVRDRLIDRMDYGNILFDLRLIVKRSKASVGESFNAIQLLMK